MFDPAAAVTLLKRDAEALDRAEVKDGLAEAGRLRAWADAREAKLISRLGRLDDDPADPAKDEADRLQREQNIGRGEARKRTETAEQLEHLPATQDALENGEITGDHAAALAQGRAKADDSAKAALANAEDELLEQAGTETPQDFRKRVERFIADHADDDGLDEHDRKRANTRLRLWDDDEGMVRIAGALNPELGGAVRSTLGRQLEEQWRAERSDRDDQPVPWGVRTSEQRLAEALGEACRRADGADVRDGRRVRPRVGVVLDHETLVGDDDRPGETADGTPVPAAVARRRSCNAGILPIVLGGDGVPLDWGRARRFATPNQVEALLLQHATCTLFGCTAKAAWCDAHHIEPWEPTGPTNLANLTLACDHCHDLVHRKGYGVTKDPRGRALVGPRRVDLGVPASGSSGPPSTTKPAAARGRLRVRPPADPGVTRLGYGSSARSRTSISSV